jgi:hypothetical protein
MLKILSSLKFLAPYPPGMVRLRLERNCMTFRAATTLALISLTAVLLALLQPVVAASNAGKVLFIYFLMMLFRFPGWLLVSMDTEEKGEPERANNDRLRYPPKQYIAHAGTQGQ